MTWPVVNKSATSVVFNAAQLCNHGQVTFRTPIDEYYGRSAEIIARSNLPNVSSDGLLLRLLVVESVSAVEQFFRVALTRLSDICPKAKTIAGSRVLSLDAVAYYGSRAALGVLEGVSFASSGEIRRQVQNLLGLEIKPGSSLAAAIAQFDTVCHLRHAVAHNQGNLAARNIAELGMSGAVFPVEVSFDALALQAAVALCHNVIRSANSFFLESTLNRWVDSKVLTGKWGRDRRQFTRLHELFHSVVDEGPPDTRAAYNGMVVTLKRQGRL